MVAAQRALGFKYVFDTNFAADLTIMEEATELLHRLTYVSHGCPYNLVKQKLGNGLWVGTGSHKGFTVQR